MSDHICLYAMTDKGFYFSLVFVKAYIRKSVLKIKLVFTNADRKFHWKVKDVALQQGAIGSRTKYIALTVHHLDNGDYLRV